MVPSTYAHLLCAGERHVMLKSTEAALRAICAADPSVNGAQVRAALAELDGKGIHELQGEPPPRAYSREQVAALLGVTRKTVTGYAKRGLLVPIYSGVGGQRARIYTGESVNALLSGKTPAKIVSSAAHTRKR